MPTPAPRDPTVLVQLSDPHIGADWGDGDPVAMLAAAVDAVMGLDVRVSGVLVTGDLADHATDEEYAQLRELVAPLGGPLYVLAGNHDDRAALRRNFDVPGAGDEPVQYATVVGALRLIVLDSTRPGEDPGELDVGRLAWLDDRLLEDPEAPTLLALHHTPLRTGMRAVDEAGLAGEARRALGAVVEHHPNVLRIAGGHLHQTIAGTLGGRQVLAAPSVYARMRPRFAAGEIDVRSGPAGVVIHRLVDGDLLSHVELAAG
jgi:3',5'-cyclic AMP phosphodiesterase CpdA